MSSNVLAAKDVNAPFAIADQTAVKGDVKSMEYHRQVLQNKMEQEKSQQYISPSDNIMSPCSAKLNALRNKQIGKVKPKSLFAQASSKKLDGDALFGAKSRSIPKVNDS
ncbi:hypothetical protein HYQ45_012384 [Verticillium longisporum]|uniref:Spo12-like protein n=9 Tax=Verticillium TaxID=1036719 RepID=G2XE82_VERDV|nr:conserved hypothetical protein [Verticillium alfalfae VaMs.102]XP_009658484.1 uncharacterized protein VDAG_08464 [Verticillium dahliae VdLs.17]XP_028494142.1 uncharacterized protein D7B24_007878 [Verticillium nonalfalfae]KAG7121825.1 hypothetical protein HYQ45_014311 [Verticillium longisporum]KAH6698886.1 hypothetical protein EV126DRAFT_425492 [Verticillium dahliae]EEY14073.1 conserved hypothetical protein [Verticillium alfalfae VaMs.102]EGY18130.1 hypothetical protein VDAG_08464 [Verticil